jgi:hypothetical protein
MMDIWYLFQFSWMKIFFFLGRQNASRHFHQENLIYDVEMEDEEKVSLSHQGQFFFWHGKF